MTLMYARAQQAGTNRTSRRAPQVATAMLEPTPSSFQLCFRSLFHGGRSFAFPCDNKGQVSLDTMSERVRNDYFYARAMVGRELEPPAMKTPAVSEEGRRHVPIKGSYPIRIDLPKTCI